jgi:hypothetical protein
MPENRLARVLLTVITESISRSQIVGYDQTLKGIKEKAIMEPSTCEHLTETSERAKEVAHRAYAMLEAHAHFRGRAGRFELVCQEDILVVRGAVPSFYLKQVLQTVLRDLDGVRRIDNQVQVISAESAIGEWSR